MGRTLFAVLVLLFAVSAPANAACREGKFIIKPQADGSNLIVDECQPAAKAPRRAPGPRQEAKTPPNPATAEAQPEAKPPIKTDILGFALGMSEEEMKGQGAKKENCHADSLNDAC